MGQNVSLTCFCKNVSVDVTYSLFLGKRYLDSKRRRGKAMTFHLKISSASETGPYKCKANASHLWKYSQEFNFTIASKCLSMYDGGPVADGTLSCGVRGSWWLKTRAWKEHGSSV